MASQTEDHRLMFADDLGKGEMIASGCFSEGLLHSLGPLLFQAPCPFPPHHAISTQKNNRENAII
jgi:hypothetical protein